jgi:hypothetical protein
MSQRLRRTTDVRHRYPSLGWVRSIHGRDLLWQALRKLDALQIEQGLLRDDDPTEFRREMVHEFTEDARRLFQAAVGELRAAAESGDPSAGVALACALEQQVMVGLGKRKDRAEATRVIESTVAMLQELDPHELGPFVLVRHIYDRTWTWPEDPRIRRALAELPRIEHADAPTIRIEEQKDQSRPAEDRSSRHHPGSSL